MAQFVNMFDVDLDHRSYPVNMNQTVAEGNVSANRIGAYVYQNGSAYNLGGNCTGLVMRADGSTVPLTGVIDGNAAYVVLDQSSCAIPGPIQVAVNWVSGSKTTTLIVAYGTVIHTDTRAYIQPGTPVPDINTLLAAIENMETATAAANAAAEKSVRYDTTQELTNTQKNRARSNIDVPSNADLTSLADNKAVRYDTTQELTTAQKNRAIGNIGAASAADLTALADNKAVRYDAAQSITAAKQSTARGNIGAASAADLATETTEREAADNDLKSALNVDTFNLEKAYDEIIGAQKEINGTINIPLLFGYGYFEAAGYGNVDGRYVHSQILPAGSYKIVAPEGYQWEAYNYVSDSSGTVKFSYRTSVDPGNFNDPFVLTFRHTTNPSSTIFPVAEVKNLAKTVIAQLNNASTNQIVALKSELTPILNALSDGNNHLISSLSLSQNIDAQAFDYTVSDDLYTIEKELKQGTLKLRPDFQYGVFEGSGYVLGNGLRVVSQVFQPGTYSISVGSGYQYEIYTYNSDSSGTLKYSFRTSLENEFFNAPFVITVQHSTDPGSTAFTIEEVVNLRKNVMTLTVNNSVSALPKIGGVDVAVVPEFYLLDITYTPYGVSATSGSFRMKLKDGNGTIRVVGEDVGPEYYSDKIQRFVDYGTGDVVAYYIIHYPGSNYAVDSTSLAFTDFAKSLDYNSTLKEYLSREENLVLIGDSIFGYYGKNVLEAFLAGMSNKQVFNCAFGGCRMAWRAQDGSNDYDAFSFPSVVNSIVAGDYSTQLAKMEINQGYPYRVASLQEVDFTKPTTILVNYVNNDLTGGVAIGDEWEYTDTASGFDKTTVLGAFNYGVQTLLDKYPHIRVIEFTSAWRKIGDNNLPPYVYENGIGLKAKDYDDAIKANAEKQGIAVYDFHKYGGRNWYNIGYYQQDGSHYNEKGFALFAKIIDAVDRGFID